MSELEPRPVLPADADTGPAVAIDQATRELPVVVEAAPRRPWWRRRPVLLGSAAVVVAAGAGVGIWLGTSGGATSAGIHVTTEVVRVTTGTIKETVAASGTIEPAQESDLDFAVSGKVTAVDATVGQKVTAGQPLATIAPTALQAQQASAQAALTSAEAKLSTDEADGASTSQLTSDEAAVTSAQATLTTADKSLADASLTSPISGTVASVDLTVGQEVTGSGAGAADHGASTSTGGSSAATQVEVVSTDSFVVDTTVDDTEVAKVAAGDQAVITPTGATTPIYGTIASVSMIAWSSSSSSSGSSGSSGVASFPVVIDVTGNPTGVYAGSSAAVSMVVKQLNDVVEVPSDAISYSTSQATVTVVEHGGQHVTQPVTVGTTANGETQITHGLAAGQQIMERVVSFSGSPGTGGGTGLFGGRTPGGGGGHFFSRTGTSPLGGAIPIGGGAGG